MTNQIAVIGERRNWVVQACSLRFSYKTRARANFSADTMKTIHCRLDVDMEKCREAPARFRKAYTEAFQNDELSVELSHDWCDLWWVNASHRGENHYFRLINILQISANYSWEERKLAASYFPRYLLRFSKNKSFRKQNNSF